MIAPYITKLSEDFKDVTFASIDTTDEALMQLSADILCCSDCCA